MQVVVKTPPIDVSVEGMGVSALVDILKKCVPGVQVIDNEDQAEDIDGWDYYNTMKSRLTPAKRLKIRRENAGLSRATLAKKCSIASSNITLMENGKQPIEDITARKLATALNCDTSDFI